MYCDQCGHSVSTNAKFCPSCGAPVADRPVPIQTPGAPPVRPLAYAATRSDRIPADEPIRVVRPIFVGWVVVLGVVPITVFMTIWAGGFCGGFSSIPLHAVQRTGVPVLSAAPFLFWAAAAFFGIPLGTYYAKRRSYARTEYRFFRDRLEVYEGFAVVQQKTVDYRGVIEVDLRKGPVQRQYGLGTIILTTPTSEYSNRGRKAGGIRIADVPDPDGLYEEVKRLVRNAKDRAPRDHGGAKK